MGGKPSNSMQSNRPESGGADRDQEREKSGTLERDKNKFAAEQKQKSESRPASREETAGKKHAPKQK
jgi:hypothetical protein